MTQRQLVYCINCINCDKVYIGETRRFLRTRLIEHEKSIIHERLVSALTVHALSCKHNFDFDNVSILCRERDDYIRKMKESFYILKNNSITVNYKCDTENNVRYCSHLINKLIR